MPFDVRTQYSAGDAYADVFVGPADHSVQILLDVDKFTSAHVDSDGFLIPGCPIRENGTPVLSASQYVHGVLRERVRVGYDGTSYGNSNAILDAATDIEVAVFTAGQVDKGTMEDNLGRVLTQNEVDAFEDSGTKNLLLIDRALNT